jgi:hypothetical protein
MARPGRALARLTAREGQRLRRRRDSLDVVDRRLDIRTIPALRDRHWVPRKRRLPEDCGAVAAREYEAARPAGMSVAWNAIHTF